MTAAIQTSLSQLGRSVENLETSVSIAQANVSNAAQMAQSNQNDLFGGGPNIAPKKEKAAANDIDPKALASRLDSAIAKVEKILKEG